MKTPMICSTLDNTAILTEDLCLVLKNGRKETEKTPLSLPKTYEKDGKKTAFVWEFYSAEQKDNAFSVLFTDVAAGFKFLVNVTARNDIKGPVEYGGALINTGASDIRIIPGTLFTLKTKLKSPTSWIFMKESGVAEGVHWSKGEYFKDGPGIYKKVLSRGKSVEAETNVNQDFNCGGAIPLIYLDNKEKNGLYVGVEWTSHRILAKGETGGVRVSVDYHDGFTTVIPGSGKLDIMPIYLGFYDGDVDDGSNVFKRWFFLTKTPKSFLLNEREPMTQIDNQIHPEKCAEHGIESIKWDFGWWTNKRLPDNPEGGIWSYYNGSWKLRAEGMINYIKSFGKETLAEYGKYLEDLGINWTIYILLHDSLCELSGDDELTSVGPAGHPEWFSNRKIADLHPVADLGNTECVEYIKRKLTDFFTETHAKGWRSDFEPIARSSDKKNRHDANGNDVQYWCSKGFFEIVDYLIENIPGFRYECCSSGGSMKDFAIMRRASIFNNDDSADYVSLRTTFYDSSYCFPPAQLQLPCDPSSFCPECEKFYCKVGDKDFGMRSMMEGAVMLSSWSGHENGHLKYGIEDLYKKYLPFYIENIKPLIRHANLYHILPRPDMKHWDGIQYGTGSKDGINGLGGATFIFKPTNEEGDTKHIRVRGLNKKARYSVEFFEHKEQNCVKTGRELTENGLDVTIHGDCGSDIILYKVVK